jgi:hypothetical protein
MSEHSNPLALMITAQNEKEMIEIIDAIQLGVCMLNNIDYQACRMPEVTESYLRKRTRQLRLLHGDLCDALRNAEYYDNE